MKKLNLKQKQRHDRLTIQKALKTLHRKEVLDKRRKFGTLKNSRGEPSITPPKTMSFNKNYGKTVAFFEELKNRHTQRRKDKLKNKRKKTNNLIINLDQIEEISIPAAVVLAAELDRWRRLDGISLRPYRFTKWAPQMKKVMHDLGVFDLLHVKWLPIDESPENATVTLVKLKSDDRADGVDVKELFEKLTYMTDRFSSKPYLYTGLSEAIQNVVEHAYPPDINLKYAASGSRWWATVSLDLNTEILRFLVYDQGVGIPKTLPAQGFWEEIRVWVEKFSGDTVSSDALLLRAAMDYGRTGTSKSNRGKGLAKMAEVIEEAGEGKIRIISGKAEITKDIHGVRTRDLNTHIGGTLIEWSIPLKVFEILKGDKHAYL